MGVRTSSQIYHVPIISRLGSLDRSLRLLLVPFARIYRKWKRRFRQSSLAVIRKIPHSPTIALMFLRARTREDNVSEPESIRTVSLPIHLFKLIEHRANGENKDTSGYVTDTLLNMLYVDGRFADHTPLLELLGLDPELVSIRDNKQNKVVNVRTKKEENEVKLYCELDKTDYCTHTSFVEAFSGLITAITGERFELQWLRRS